MAKTFTITDESGDAYIWNTDTDCTSLIPEDRLTEAVKSAEASGAKGPYRWFEVTEVSDPRKAVR